MSRLPMGSRERRDRKPEPGRALTRQRPVGTLDCLRRYGRAIYPARQAHDTRPLNAPGSLGNYLRKERPFGLAARRCTNQLPRAVGDHVDEDGEVDALARFRQGKGGETGGLSEGPSEERI